MKKLFIALALLSLVTPGFARRGRIPLPKPVCPTNLSCPIPLPTPIAF